MKISAGLLLLAVVTASPDLRYSRYEQPILNAPQQAGQTCLALDIAVFAHASAQLADLRLYHNGDETPYVIRTASLAEGAERSIAPMNLGVRKGQIVFDAELPDTHYSDLQLDVIAQNFIATVTVSGSRTKDGRVETSLGAYTIFDLTRQKLGRSTVLHLPESDFPYLHFQIAGPLERESITGLSVERLPGSPPAYRTIAETSQVVRKGRSSIVEFTVPAHVPVDRVAFTPSALPALFSRDVNIRVTAVPAAPVTDGAEPPQSVVASGDLLRVHSNQNGHRIDEERLSVDAPATHFDTPAKWTVTIDNGDDVPLTLTSIRLQMLERTLCFEAAAGTSYTLYYGDPALAAPRYDYARLFVAQANASLAIAGPEQLNSRYQPRPDERPFTEKHPALLWAALIAVIVLLGAIALRSAKRQV
ncbi:MAG TPA: DUF3999 family protein [Terracidiphilus sp.]|nr:DUF3999 family protein [Terracidiphilus sp.]